MKKVKEKNHVEEGESDDDIDDYPTLNCAKCKATYCRSYTYLVNF
jgi:hypothetical protein